MSTRRRDDRGEVHVAAFSSAILDPQEMRAVCDRLSQLSDELGPCTMALDFRNVQYVGTPALGALITLNKRLAAAGGRLVLCSLSREVREVFEITKLDSLFRIEDVPPPVRGETQVGTQGRGASEGTQQPGAGAASASDTVTLPDPTVRRE